MLTLRLIGLFVYQLMFVLPLIFDVDKGVAVRFGPMALVLASWASKEDTSM